MPVPKRNFSSSVTLKSFQISRDWGLGSTGERIKIRV